MAKISKLIDVLIEERRKHGEREVIVYSESRGEVSIDTDMVEFNDDNEPAVVMICID